MNSPSIKLPSDHPKMGSHLSPADPDEHTLSRATGGQPRSEPHGSCHLGRPPCCPTLRSAGALGPASPSLHQTKQPQSFRSPHCLSLPSLCCQGRARFGNMVLLEPRDPISPWSPPGSLGSGRACLLSPAAEHTGVSPTSGPLPLLFTSLQCPPSGPTAFPTLLLMAISFLPISP